MERNFLRVVATLLHFSRTVRLTVLLSILIPCPAWSETKTPPAKEQPPYVRVFGEATISVPPDHAELDIGVISQGNTSKSATDLNAKQSAAVVDQLRSVFAAANLQTVNFSVNPNYRFPKEGGTPEILGYTANNTVRVSLDDLLAVRKVIDVAVKAGASNVNRLNFLLRDEDSARASALSQAAKQARTGAEALAATLKRKLGDVMTVEEGQPVIVSSSRQPDLATEKLGSAEATLEVGAIQIHASVSLTFELK